MLRQLRIAKGDRLQKPRLLRVDRSHPEARAISRAYLVGEGTGVGGAWKLRDCVNGNVANYVRNNADTYWTMSANGRTGPFFKIGADGGGPPPIEAAGAFAHAADFSAFASICPTGGNPFLEVVTANGLCSAVCTRDASGSTSGISLALTSDGGWAVVNGPGILLGAKLTGATINNDQWYTLAATFKRDTSITTYGGTFRFYLDGVLRAQNNYNFAGPFGGTLDGTTLTPFGNPNAVPSVSDKYAGYLYTFDRELDAAEIARYHQDPFKICYPAKKPSRFFVGGAPPPPPPASTYQGAQFLMPGVQTFTGRAA